MLTLAINTASSHTAIALLDGDKLLREDSWQSRNDEAEKLMPAIHALLRDKKFSQIKRVLVIKGPGSFTGLRIGVTVANTIAYLNKCDLFALNTFEYLSSSDIAADAILVFAGKGGVYVSTDGKDGKLVNLDDLNAHLETNKIQTTFGDISPEQKAALTTAKFIELKESFGQIIAKIDTHALSPLPLIEPYYIKPPSITKPKCST